MRGLPAWLGCLVAVLGVALAYFVQKAVWSLMPAAPFLLFYPVIFFAAWMGGKRCGVMAAVLSVLVVDYEFLPPSGRFNFRGNWLSESIFFAICCGIVV